jgi:hypothetical protein
MMAYSYALFLHSWLRWGVLASGLLLLTVTFTAVVRRRSWSTSDRRLVLLFLSTLDAQLLLGLLLYFSLSPITPRNLSDLRAFLGVAPLRFFAVEHPTGILIGALCAHLGWARGKRTLVDRDRHRRVLVGVLLALLAIGLSVPWPWFPYGRPLFRLP